MNRLLTYLGKLSLAKRELLKWIFVWLIELPVIGRIYHRVYSSLIKRKAARSLTLLDIETYNVCNLRCTMCPYLAMTREKVLMSMALFQKIIDDAAANSIKEVCLIFYNEPLLDPLLYERIKYAKSKGIRVNFNSNGSLLTEEKINQLLDSGLDQVTFSFDGATKETYENIRVGANYEKTRDGIIQLIQERNRRGLKHPRVMAYLVAQKDNYREIAEFKSLWNEFADEVSIGLVDNRAIAGLSPGELKIKKPRCIYPCRSIFEHMFVMSNGKVALCCMDYDGTFVLGDLSKQSIKEVWNSSKIKEIRELHLSGQGDRIELCRDTNCRLLHKEGSYWWWKQ